MKVLFVPYCGTVISHHIPLLTLNRMLDRARFETAFLAPQIMHPLLRHTGARVLDIDHNGFRTDMLAYGKFEPDVVVDDGSYSSGVSTALTKVARVAVMRTGMFPGSVRRNRKHIHSMAIFNKACRDISMLGLSQPRSVSDLFLGDINLVPGIPSVELLPAALQNDDSYVYSGPLLLEDLLIAHWSSATEANARLAESTEFDSLELFFESNRGRKIVYVTFGTQASATAELVECIGWLLDHDIAVVSSVRTKHGWLAERLTRQQRELFYHADYLPMHFVCARADLMVHHCGSGTYHYPLLHGLPAITVGTQKYDRDDVAVRLQELGVSVHIPAPEECERFVQTFKAVVNRYFDSSGELMSRTKEQIETLRLEIERTVSAFNFAEVLQRACVEALNQNRRPLKRIST